MSIIYDALQKAEKTNSTLDKPQKIPLKNKTYLLYIITGIFGFFAAQLFFNFITSSFQETGIVDKKTAPVIPKVIKPQAGILSLSKSPFASEQTNPQKDKNISADFNLTGIVFSQDARYALINNKIVNEGDKIEGATVVNISENEVELKGEKLNLKLYPKK